MFIFFKLLIPATLLSLASFSASSNYKLNNYGINSGGSNSTSSSTYSANVGAGEVGGGATGAATYSIKSGSIAAQQAGVPGAPTLSNGSNTYYNKLNFILDTGGNPSDTTFAVAVATTSNFSSLQYVQADGTLGSNPVWQTYTQWGGSSGTFAIGLTASTTYWFKAEAMQGQFTATAFGPSANAATVSSSPALSFSISPNSINLGSLTSGSIISSSNLSFTFSANAVSGGTIYVMGTSTGLTSAAVSHTIDVTAPSGNLLSLDEGFGLQGTSASSPLSTQSPYASGSNTVGAIYTSFQPLFSSTSAVTSGTATAVLKAKASVSTPNANDYTVTLTFVAAASY
jgi:hypothetical protein